ncbi:MAG TPA: gamma carbonic anhydrase family protein [Gammaproteobacteria bacterium]|nr:gamma carbonic anhydrase family protein [Gammaproteobacteria bacterium]
MNLQPYRDWSPTLGARVYVADSARVIGRVSLAEDASIWPFCAVRGDVNSIEIGARSNIQDATVIHVTHDGPYTPGGIPTIIGSDVTVGHKCLLHACTIGNFCLIGMGATVMDGAVLEDEVFLAAGSLVSPGKRLESGYLYRGSPARKVRALSDTEKEQLHYSAAHYVRLKDEYLAMAE